MPATACLDRKDRLWDNYKHMQDSWGKKVFNFIPQTFNLPREEQMLMRKMKRKKSIWIVKPPSKMCGDGIRLVTDPAEVLDSRLVSIIWKDPAHADILRPKQNLCVQKYISNPFLVRGLKFDLRLYVLLTSIDPIKLYLYDDGLVRFATKPFSTNKEDLNDKFAHLTNYSVNKESEEFIQNSDPSECEGHKWSLKTFWKYLESQGHDWSKIWSKIKDIVIKAILCGHSDICGSYKQNVGSTYNCYKLFGIDIFLDERLRPWLLELNNFPSLCTPALDRHVNQPMIAEMFNIVGFQLTSKMSPKQKASLRKRYSLEGPLDFDSRLYSTGKSEDEKVKEEEFVEAGRTSEYHSAMVEEDKLTGGDVRKLVMAEEELSQTVGFIRLFPSNTSDKYLDYLRQPCYSDRLLAAWEKRWGEERGDGRELLARLCRKGVQFQ